MTLNPLEFSTDKAHKTQVCMSKRIIAEDRLPKKIDVVAGVDVAYDKDLSFGAAVVLNYLTMEVLEIQTSLQTVKFPYVSTLLAFREVPAAFSAIKKLRLQPDVILVDGHGKAHPYGCGFASHLGLILKMPTIGVAKSRLVGETKRAGSRVFVVLDGEVVGEEVTTQKGSKPIYVSVGHLISLQTAIAIVKHCSRESRIPEPIRQAHNLASKERKINMDNPSNKVGR